MTNDHTQIRPLTDCNTESIYRLGDRIRRTEQLILKQFDRGLVSGTTHTCIGQEVCQISVVRALTKPHDVVLSNHRNHGHFLTYSGEYHGLVAEVMGREAGVCGGRGGSQHLAYLNFHSNGIQGGMTGIAVGYALVRKLNQEDGLVAVFIGDGTLGQGLVYESMNLASIWNVPVLFVVENNGIAQTTYTTQTTGGNILDRGKAFGLESLSLDDSDADFIENVDNFVSGLRASQSPGFLVINTMRMGPHSKGDDLRSEEEKSQITSRDPLDALGKTLPDNLREMIQSENKSFIEELENSVQLCPESKFSEVPKSIYKLNNKAEHIAYSAPDTLENANVRQHLNHALSFLLEKSANVILLGEDLHDPYGGAFKVTAGLSTKFKEKVISTPISEAGITGSAIGMALSGYKPIVELMFADFLTLAMDQLYNHAVKFPGIFENTELPLVIRTPCGGGRGYGPTHSQSPENICATIPGLTVVYPSHRHDSGQLLVNAVVGWNYPLVFLEHKLLYGETQNQSEYSIAPHLEEKDNAIELFPTLVRRRATPDLTLVTYGGSVVLAESVSDILEKTEELNVDIIVPCLLSPLPRNSLLENLKDSPLIVIIEESHESNGVGSEIAACLAESAYTGKVLRIGTPPVPIPSARTLENEVLPSVEKSIERILSCLEEE